MQRSHESETVSTEAQPNLSPQLQTQPHIPVVQRVPQHLTSMKNLYYIPSTSNCSIPNDAINTGASASKAPIIHGFLVQDSRPSSRASSESRRTRSRTQSKEAPQCVTAGRQASAHSRVAQSITEPMQPTTDVNQQVQDQVPMTDDYSNLVGLLMRCLTDIQLAQKQQQQQQLQKHQIPPNSQGVIPPQSFTSTIPTSHAMTSPFMNTYLVPAHAEFSSTGPLTFNIDQVGRPLAMTSSAPAFYQSGPMQPIPPNILPPSQPVFSIPDWQAQIATTQQVQPQPQPAEDAVERLQAAKKTGFVLLSMQNDEPDGAAGNDEAPQPPPPQYLKRRRTSRRCSDPRNVRRFRVIRLKDKSKSWIADTIDRPMVVGDLHCSKVPLHIKEAYSKHRNNLANGLKLTVETAPHLQYTLAQFEEEFGAICWSKDVLERFEAKYADPPKAMQQPTPPQQGTEEPSDR